MYLAAKLGLMPIEISPRSSATENFSNKKLESWAIVQHCLHDDMFSHFVGTLACDK